MSVGLSAFVRSLAACALVLAAGACSMGDSTGPKAHPPTVLVTNATCAAGRCATLDIRAFVFKFTVPQPPQGFGNLGEAHPGQTCLTFPASWPLRIIGPDTAGKMDTTTMTWTPDDTVGIYLIAIDSQAWDEYFDGQLDSSNVGPLPYDGLAPGSLGETRDFVPGDSAGWSASFPSAPVRGGLIVGHAECTP